MLYAYEEYESSHCRDGQIIPIVIVAARLFSAWARLPRGRANNKQLLPAAAIAYRISVYTVQLHAVSIRSRLHHAVYVESCSPKYYELNSVGWAHRQSIAFKLCSRSFTLHHVQAYINSLSTLISSCYLNHRLYADDTQSALPFLPSH